MGYNLYIEHILGLGHCDTTWSWKCIKDIVSRHPNVSYLENSSFKKPVSLKFLIFCFYR